MLSQWFDQMSSLQFIIGKDPQMICKRECTLMGLNIVLLTFRGHHPATPSWGTGMRRCL